MPLVRKAVTRPRGDQVVNGDLSRQHGHSANSLATEAAASALREFARGHPNSKPSSTTSTESRESNTPNRIATQDAPKSSSNTPNPFSSAASPASSCYSASLADTSSGDGVPGLITETNLSASKYPTRAALQTTRRAPHGPNSSRRSRPQYRSRPSSRSQTPTKVSELGHDYSRYPRSDFAKFFIPISTPAPAYHSPGLTEPPRLVSPTSAKGKNPEPVSNLGYTEKSSSWVLDDRLGAPFSPNVGKLALFKDEKELDDDMHMPQPDDDVRLKPKLRDFFAPAQMGSLFGLIFMFLGLMTLFILLPVLSYTGTAIYIYPYDNSGSTFNNSNYVDPAFHVNDLKYSLLQNVRQGLIDPTTPQSAMTRNAFDGQQLELVFSDEFNTPNRTFYQGDDPYFFAPDFWYGATEDLEWYDPDAVTTSAGTLMLTMEQFFNHNLNYRSGMLNSWNQLCFKGGALEISVSMPGPGGASGLWPGAWAMGNLGRPGYGASTEGVWPYTYNSCDIGITPNQSMTDGTSYLPGQKLPSCTCAGEDHPTPGTGRGAPEIDVFEGSADPELKLGVVTQSYQVAPFDIWWQPNYDFSAIPNENSTQLNVWCGGPYQQAISSLSELNNKWYNGTQYQRYGFEYQPGISDDGQITWFVGDDISFQINGNAVGPNGNVNSRPISQEPMSIILNLGISPTWTGIDFGELLFPTVMYVDYVRIYQAPGQSLLTCDPPGYETTQYIKNHPEAYQNINLTKWSETPYAWPKHKLNTDC